MAKYYTPASHKASQKYMREKMLSVSFRLSKVYEQELIDIYRSIPANEKSTWFKNCLRDYGQKQKKNE